MKGYDVPWVEQSISKCHIYRARSALDLCQFGDDSRSIEVGRHHTQCVFESEPRLAALIDDLVSHRISYAFVPAVGVGERDVVTDVLTYYYLCAVINHFIVPDKIYIAVGTIMDRIASEVLRYTTDDSSVRQTFRLRCDRLCRFDPVGVDPCPLLHFSVLDQDTPLIFDVVKYCADS